MRRVLIAPLDWGLGHATRCIPVIRELQLQGCDVLIAGSGDSLQLLRREFSRLRVFPIPGYAPRYHRSGSMVWSMAQQLARFTNVINAEHRAVGNIIGKENIDLLISDNRYGCWSPRVPSVFITHQINILMPSRFGWFQHLVRRASDRMINHFSLCWIPDLPDGKSLAGDLIAFGKSKVTIPREHIGWLSRFEARQPVPKKYDVIAVLSGPEPQRTILENILLPQLMDSHLSYRVVRGLPLLTSARTDHRIVDFLASAELQEELMAADLVIARSGFSTVMDMQALSRKVVFIPTPGQTEQEYLAQRLMEKGIAFFMPQDKFSLRAAISGSRNFSGFQPVPKNTLLKEAVQRILG